MAPVAVGKRNERPALSLKGKATPTISNGVFAMASALTRFRDDLQDDVQDQIARLSREVASLRKTMTKRGGAAYEDARDAAGDLYDDLWDRVHDAMPDIRRGARRARETARDNPVVTAAVTVGVIGLLVTLLARRS